MGISSFFTSLGNALGTALEASAENRYQQFLASHLLIENPLVEVIVVAFGKANPDGTMCRSTECSFHGEEASVFDHPEAWVARWRAEAAAQVAGLENGDAS